MLHHIAGATIQVANLVTYNCHPLEAIRFASLSCSLEGLIYAIVIVSVDLKVLFVPSIYILIILLDFLLTVNAAPHECVIRTSQP